MEASKSNICKVCLQARDQGRAYVTVLSLKAVGWQNPLLSGGGQSFILFRLSVDWMKPTHIMEGNLLYSKPINLNVNLI